MQENTTPVGKLRKHLAQLADDRRSFEKAWLDAKNLVLPKNGRFLTSTSESEVNNGSSDTRRRITGAATRALNILANGIQSGLTSKARQWFELAHPDPQVGKSLLVRNWYDQVQDIMEAVFRRSNVYSALLHVYREMAAFGTGAMGVFEHPTKVLYCRAYTIGTYYVSTDQWMDVDAFFSIQYLTASQMELEYGLDALPERVKSALNSDRREDRFKVIHAVLRHPEAYGIPAEDGRYASVHFLDGNTRSDGTEQPLRISHYDTWPIMVPRWDTVDVDVYGSGPLEDVMDDVKMVMSMEVDALKSIAKGVNPPMRIPPELARTGLNMKPGGLNVVSSLGEHAVAPLLMVNANVQQLQFKIDRVVQEIKDGLYNSLFLALLSQDNPQMTAREVAERHEEKLLMLGPVLERIHYELLDPLISRSFALCQDAGLIPPAPEGADLSGTEVEYVSILSQAQKAVGVSRIEQSVAFLGSLVALYPEARHLLDVKKTYEEYNSMIGVRANIFTTEDEYKASVDADKKMADAQLNAEMAPQLAAAGKTASEMNPADLERILTGGMGGALL